MMEDAEIVLREYRRGDLNEIVRLDEVCFAEAFRFDRESMRLFAEARNAISLIAESEGKIAGFVIVHVDHTAAGWQGYVVTLDVAMEHRRRGLAERLMQAAEILAEAAGAGWMELHVFTGNEGAIRFYERMGYVRVGEQRRFYGAEIKGQEDLDAFVYRKELAAAETEAAY
jgi:ribosomal-protein-alanine N-acetyltransferase